ncbi:MAG TPA: STAS domain-containing protein [Jatrophihabitantaceae bacterium]|nr:STAS domain-containing protein [Jatrophihabitantaceae bacterium]
MLVRLVERTDTGSGNDKLSVTCLSRGRTALRGDLDVSGRDTLACAGREIVTNGRGVITLDLADITFMDAAGITALIDLAQLARARGRAVVLARPSPSVQRVLAIVTALEALPFAITARRRSIARLRK